MSIGLCPISNVNNQINCHVGYFHIITASNVRKFLSAINEWYKHNFRQIVQQVISSEQLNAELSALKKQLRASQQSLQSQKVKDLRQFSVEHFRKLENRIKILQQKLRRTPSEPSKLFRVDQKGQFIA